MSFVNLEERLKVFAEMQVLSKLSYFFMNLSFFVHQLNPYYMSFTPFAIILASHNVNSNFLKYRSLEKRINQKLYGTKLWVNLINTVLFSYVALLSCYLLGSFLGAFTSMVFFQCINQAILNSSNIEDFGQRNIGNMSFASYIFDISKALAFHFLLVHSPIVALTGINSGFTSSLYFVQYTVSTSISNMLALLFKTIHTAYSRVVSSFTFSSSDDACHEGQEHSESIKEDYFSKIENSNPRTYLASEYNKVNGDEVLDHKTPNPSAPPFNLL